MGAPEIEPVGLQLTRTAKTVSRAFDDALATAGGSLPLWLILVSVQGQVHGAQRELAEAVGVEGPTLTHHLNRMEKAGLVTRRRDPDNRRVHQVELTDAGRATFFALLDKVVVFDERLRRGFSDRDLAQLRRLLDRLAANATSPDDNERTEI
jgi:MarR family transcriptional regulator for hemolysin